MNYSLTLILAVVAASAQAQTLTTLASFGGPSENPNSLIQGADGNFYGTTGKIFGPYGPPSEPGVVFKLTPSGTLTTLYSFPSSHPTSLLQASDGNFYGTTPDGGTNAACNSKVYSHGCGTIFKLTPAGSLTTLHNFGGRDGANPSAGLIQAKDGTLYGTADYGGTVAEGGTLGFGTIFSISATGTLTTLYNFSGTDGAVPNSLLQAVDGNFYGTTQAGGPTLCSLFLETSGCGTAFQITPAGSLTTLANFDGADQSYNPGVLLQATDGNFYGMAAGSDYPFVGIADPYFGTVFQLTPSGQLTTLHRFDLGNLDGAFPGGYPPSSLIQGAGGNLYGITPEGGADAFLPDNLPNNCGGLDPNGLGCGTIFQISTTGTYARLYTFCAQPNCTDGAAPSSLLLVKDEDFYGTTSGMGANGGGTAFQFSLISPDVPAISPNNGVVNGASFQPGISPGSWITINGTNLSPQTDTWVNAIVKGALPTTLDGVSVMVGDQAAYIEYVSPTQINAVVPNVPAGTVPVTVTTSSGTSQAVTVQLSAEQPAFFQWGTYAVATRQDFSLAVKNGTFPGTTTVPAKPGDVIILWGTGFGPTSPSAPAGQETPSTTTYNTATTVSVTVGGKPATVYGAALAPGYAGLYQVAIQIPASLTNGDYPVVATIAGAQSPSTTLITVQK
jgi:uncharacterized protein (TIGR03437 family)